MSNQKQRKPIEKHGDTRAGGYRAAEYSVWVGMIQRCENPKATFYSRYGGRGIRVCRRWRWSYIAFLADMKRRPGSEYSIERIDNNGDYEPGNCRWALVVDQARNKRTNNVIFAFGEERCITDWASELGCMPGTISGRIERSWSAEDAVSVPAISYDQYEITIDNETMSASAWAERSGTHENTIRHRIRCGWLSAEAVFGVVGLHGIGRKPSRFITVKGETLSMAEWARRTGIGDSTIERRLDVGWSEEDAVLTPVSKSKHGTLSMYTHNHCRCEPCKEAGRVYSREAKIRRKQKKI